MGKLDKDVLFKYQDINVDLVEYPFFKEFIG